MEHWQRMVLDPGHFAVLKNLEIGKKVEEIASETGINMERCRKILQRLEEENLVQTGVENGTRKFRRENLEKQEKQLFTELKSRTFGGTRKAVEKREYGEAREHLTHELPVEGENRISMAKLEAAEKLSKIS